MSKSILVLLVMFAAPKVFACNSTVFESGIEYARDAAGETLNCLYNGESSKGVISVATPRCPGAKSVVTILVFGERVEVTKITGKTIRGIKKYTTQYTIESNKFDFSMICRTSNK